MGIRYTGGTGHFGKQKDTVNNGITQEQDSCRLKWVCKSKWTLNQKL